MAKHTIMILSLALLFGAPDASAQSLKGLLKKAVKKVEQRVKQEVDQEVDKQVDKHVKQTVRQGINQVAGEKAGKAISDKVLNQSSNQSSRDAELEKLADTYLGPDGNKNMEDEAPTVRLPKTHTAFFAPLGYPIEERYGTRTVKPSTPPQKADAQVNWSSNLPDVTSLDNQSLVDEYLLLKGLVDDGYIVNLTPAHWRYIELVVPELWNRVSTLNTMVSQYNEIMDEYTVTVGDGTYNWVINGLHRRLVETLSSTAYKTLLRSSLKPIFSLEGDYAVSEDAKKYFEERGGYEKARTEKWTVWDPTPNKESISTSVAGQTGTVVDSNDSGGAVDIEGVTYVLHNGKNGSKGHAFISEAVKIAIAGKDLVIPDYIDYDGRKYAVTTMRADIFSGSEIKSVKLPSTLTEISNSAFRGTPIKEIVIPASVRKIQGSAFYGCTNLVSVTFEGNSMDELHGCFQNCTALKSIKFPSRVGLMSYSMFEGCTALTDVQLPENLKEIYPQMFEKCKSLKNVDIPASVTKVGSNAFADSGITMLDLSNVKEFGGFCFMNCKSLKTVKLNASLKENFLMDVYSEQFINCPLLEVKYVNNEYVYPEGFIFVNGK